VQRQGQARHHLQAAVGLEVEHGGGADHPQRQQPGGQIARAEQDEQDPEADVQRAEQVLKREAPAGWTSCESIAAPAAAARRPGTHRTHAGPSWPGCTDTSFAGSSGRPAPAPAPGGTAPPPAASGRPWWR